MRRACASSAASAIASLPISASPAPTSLGSLGKQPADKDPSTRLNETPAKSAGVLLPATSGTVSSTGGPTLDRPHIRQLAIVVGPRIDRPSLCAALVLNHGGEVRPA